RNRGDRQETARLNLDNRTRPLNSMAGRIGLRCGGRRSGPCECDGGDSLVVSIWLTANRNYRGAGSIKMMVRARNQPASERLVRASLCPEISHDQSEAFQDKKRRPSRDDG